MDEPDIKRKLATILVADIVGYSRLTWSHTDALTQMPPGSASPSIRAATLNFLIRLA